MDFSNVEDSYSRVRCLAVSYLLGRAEKSSLYIRDRGVIVAGGCSRASQVVGLRSCSRNSCSDKDFRSSSFHFGLISQPLTLFGRLACRVLSKAHCRQLHHSKICR